MIERPVANQAEQHETIEPVTRPPKWMQEMVSRRAIAASNQVYYYAETQGLVTDDDRRPLQRDLHDVREAIETRIQAGEFDSRLAVHDATKAAISEKAKSIGQPTLDDLDAKMKWSVDDIFKLHDAHDAVSSANAAARVALKYDDEKIVKLDVWNKGTWPIENTFNPLSEVVKEAYEKTPRGSLLNTYSNLIFRNLVDFTTDDPEVAAVFEKMKERIHDGLTAIIEYVPSTGPEDFTGFQTDEEVEAEDAAREEREKPEHEKYYRNYSAYATSVGTLNRTKNDLDSQGGGVQLSNRIFDAVRAADDVEEQISKRKMDDPVEIRLATMMALIKGMQERFQPDELADLGFELTRWNEEQLRHLCAARQEIQDIIDASGLAKEGERELDEILMRNDPVLGVFRQEMADFCNRINLNEPNEAYRMMTGMSLAGALERNHPNAGALREKIRAWAQS